MGTDTHLTPDQGPLGLMSGMAMMLQSCNAEAELFDVTYWYLPQLFPDIAGRIFLMDDEAQLLKPVFHWGNFGDAATEPLPAACRVFERGVIAGTAEGNVRCDNCTCGAHCLPFRNDGSTFGILCLGRPGDDVSGLSRGLAFITAEYLTLAVSNLRLREKLYDLSIRDPLTKLFNRRHMDDVLDREIERAGEHTTTPAIALIDLDHFKNINDTFGHDAGDQVLKTVAHTLARSLPPGDTACRFGGEEFFALMKNGTPRDYTQRAETIRQNIEALDITWKEQAIKPVTASLGLALFPTHGQTPRQLIHAADQALYRAKEAGRNRVVSAL